MDQPISQKKKQRDLKRKWLKAATLFSLCLVSFYLLLNSFNTTVSRELIRSSTVMKKNITTELNAAGVIVPKQEETIASQINSRITQVFVQAGQQVDKGQLLLQLDTTKLILALDNIHEEIALKENKMTSAELNLVRISNELNGRLELLAVDLESRETKLKRLKHLANIGGISKHKITEAQLDVKRTNIEIRQLKQQTIDTEASTIADINSLKLERSMLEKSAKDQQRLIDSSQVKATRSGLLVWINNAEGSAINQGAALAKIADTSDFKVMATISDFYANQITQGMKTRFSYNKQIFDGEINAIIASDQAGILSLAITLSTQNAISESGLRLKQRIDVSLITGEIGGALVINKGPFVNGSGIKKVFVINSDTAVNKTITLSSGNSRYYQVKQGLKVGDEVIISDTSNFIHKPSINLD
jgi:HlyD family secretion protein